MMLKEHTIYTRERSKRIYPLMETTGTYPTPKKIIILAQIDYPNLGSRGHRVLAIAKQFRHHNFDVEVVIPFPETPNPSYRTQPDTFFIDGIKFRILYKYYRSISKIFLPKLFLPLIGCHIKKFAQHGVNCFFMTNMIAPISLMVVRIGHKYNIPTVNEVMDDIFGIQDNANIGLKIWQPFRSFLTRRALLESDQLWLISTYLVNQIRSLCPRQTILKIPALCDEMILEEDTVSVAKEYGLEGSKAILYAGAFGAHQGIPLLINAFQKVHEKVPQARLLLAGKEESPGYIDTLSQGIEQGDIRKLGYVAKEKLQKLCQAVDVLVAPQLPGEFSEAGFSTKFVDYLITGTPVVASRLGEQSLVAEDQREAVFFQPGSVTDLAEKLLMVLENPSWGRLIGQNGRNMALQKFVPWAALSPGIEAIKELIERRNLEFAKSV